MSHQADVPHMIVTDNPNSLLKVVKKKGMGRFRPAEASPSTIRLPIGLAVTLAIQRMSERRESDEDITSGHDERLADLAPNPRPQTLALDPRPATLNPES